MLRVHEQEQRAHQASLRAEEVLRASYELMRKAERKAKKATHTAEDVKWRIEGVAFGRALYLVGEEIGVAGVNRDRTSEAFFYQCH